MGKTKKELTNRAKALSVLPWVKPRAGAPSLSNPSSIIGGALDALD